MEGVHQKTEEEVLSELKTSRSGLSDHEARLRLLREGLNQISAGRKKSKLSIFLSNFKSPLIYLLGVAGFIALFLSKNIDALVIFSVIIINAVIGYLEESKAENTIEELKKMSALKSVVLRDGVKKTIDSSEIVRGDILVLSEGVKVSADGRIIESASLQVDESALTGESVYIDKAARCQKTKNPLEARNLVYMGTTVASGHGLSVIYATGSDTEFGKIGKLVEGELFGRTPLQRKLEKFGRQVGMVVVVISVIVYLVGTLSGNDPLIMFETAVSLAVSAIPEGLPVAITVILVLGMKRMAKKKAVIRNLSAVEALGTTTVIASDKTGTLTHNKLCVVEVYADAPYTVSGDGYGLKGDFFVNDIVIKPNRKLLNFLEAAVLSSEGEVKDKSGRTEVYGDPVDSAILVLAAKAGIIKEKLLSRFPRKSEIPFTSARKFTASQNIIDGKKEIFIKGAFEEILTRSIRYHGKKISKVKREELNDIARDMAERGLRVVAVAKKADNDGKLKLSDVRSGFDLLGFIGMRDTYRQGAKHAIDVCRGAGIKVMMLTGDHLSTARTIGHDLSILRRADEAIDASTLTGKSKSKIANLVEKTKVFARIRPEAKYSIIEALKSKGEIVAMTGDGVNDVPALVKADIGVAMGLSGTDAAKESADMILTDDNFATIVSGVEEGRTIFENIRKTIYYLFSTNIGEVFTVLGGLILGFPLVLSPIQILWMNLVTDTPTVIPLGMEPTEEDHLKKPPRDPKESILSKRIVRRTILVGLVMMVIGLWLFWSNLEVSETYARTMLFSFLIVSEWLNAFNAKSEIRSILAMNLFDNMWLIWGTVISIALQGIIMYIEPIREVFGITILSISEWGYVAVLSMAVIIVIEIDKYFTRRRMKARQ
ncbi:MAG: HAD-IC family P-type ATPase [Patescibacteria group bacterium]|nr:HAD-IC family P-type ATPase [Patescibacteria group bacterium]